MSEAWATYTEEQRLALQEKIESLLQEHLDFIASEQESQVVELDQARMGRLARIDAIQNQQAAKKQVQRIKKEIKALQKALSQLRRFPEDFGYCVDCEELIPFERLLMIPFETRCVPCAVECEKQ